MNGSKCLEVVSPCLREQLKGEASNGEHEKDWSS
jgi:hypothetical protein